MVYINALDLVSSIPLNFSTDGIDYIGIQQPVVCQHSQPPLCRNISILADLTDESVEYFHVNLRGNQTTQLDGARVVITDSGTEEGSLVRSESSDVIVQ